MATNARRSWDYPPCPECGNRLPVTGSYDTVADYECLRCGVMFWHPDSRGDNDE